MQNIKLNWLENDDEFTAVDGRVVVHKTSDPEGYWYSVAHSANDPYNYYSGFAESVEEAKKEAIKWLETMVEDYISVLNILNYGVISQ